MVLPIMIVVRRSQLLERWIKSIHWINYYPADSVVCFVNTLTHWLAIYPVDSVVQPSNNWGQFYTKIMLGCIPPTMVFAALVSLQYNIQNCIQTQNEN